MNNRPDDRTRLLAETLDGEWATGPAAAMARHAAAHARGRRRVKHAAISFAATAAALAVILLGQRAAAPVTPATITAAASMPTAYPGYEIISDDEFLATLTDRPLLVLPQENGSKKIVVLDR